MSILKKISASYGEFAHAEALFKEELLDAFTQKIYNAFCRKLEQITYIKSAEWRIRQYNASKKATLSGLLFCQSQTLLENGMINLAFYSSYYALFNALSSNLILHPHIEAASVKRISHGQIFKDIENYFIKQKIYTPQILSLLNKLRLMRELYSYHLPLGRLDTEESNDLDAVTLLRETSVLLPAILQTSSILSYLLHHAWNKKVGTINDEYEQHQEEIDEMFFSTIEAEDHLKTRIVMNNDDYRMLGTLLNDTGAPMPISWFIDEKMCEDLECNWPTDDDEELDGAKFDIAAVSRYLSDIF